MKHECKITVIDKGNEYLLTFPYLLIILERFNYPLETVHRRLLFEEMKPSSSPILKKGAA